MKIFTNKLDGVEHFVIKKGIFKPSKSIPVRVLSTNFFNNIINPNIVSLKKSLNYLKRFNNFALVLINNQNISSLKLIDKKHQSNNTLRYYGIGAQIIKDLKIKNMVLISRSRKKIIGLEGYGIKITKQEIIK